MTVAVPWGSVLAGVPTLEVRWILPGQLDTAGAYRLAGSSPEMESREDVYLLDPDLDGLSVKVRAGGALEVKVFRGSPGILDIPRRARGRLQYWQKWSFPFGSPSRDSADPGGWRRVGKQRRISRFAAGGETRCSVEITELRMPYQDWWSLGLEATGPAERLRTALEATAELVFTRPLPGGVELRLEDSSSYAEWLRSRF
jgi:hypothetical protein